MDEARYLVDVQVCDVEKRYRPSKHYVYSIRVTWSDNVEQLVFRRYSEFFDLQCKLIDTFKKDAGVYNPNDRILPFLPGKIIFGRSHIKSVALDRLHPIGIYCKKLITLKCEISRCDLIRSFFTITNEDITQSFTKDSDKKAKSDFSVATISEPIRTEEYICIHNYKATSKNELTIHKEAKCFVIEKSLNGWWFIDSSEGQGYVPQCVIQPVNYTELTDPLIIDNPEMHVVNKDYKQKRQDELSIKKGDFVYVLEKNFNGWWKIRKNVDNSIGMAPGVYLNLVNKSNVNDLERKNATPAFDLFSLDKSISSTQSESLVDISCSDTFFDHVPINPLMSSQSVDDICNIKDEEEYYVIESYQDLVGDGIDLFRGQKVKVLSKDSSTGWWYVILNNQNEGWAPGGFLSKTKPKPPIRPKPPKISNLASIINNETHGHINNGFIPINNYNSRSVRSIQRTNTSKEPIRNDLLIDINETEENYTPIKVSDMKKRFENI